MKKLLLLLIVLIAYSNANAQGTRINFSYDVAGNQIQRIICISCPNKSSQPSKSSNQLTEADLKKFSPEDDISYYPNPVKNELYLKWELVGNKTVSSISLYNINGLLLKTINDIDKLNYQNISFQELPSGVYFIGLNYNNGEQKSLKIIKN